MGLNWASVRFALVLGATALGALGCQAASTSGNLYQGQSCGFNQSQCGPTEVCLFTSPSSGQCIQNCTNRPAPSGSVCNSDNGLFGKAGCARDSDCDGGQVCHAIANATVCTPSCSGNPTQCLVNNQNCSSYRNSSGASSCVFTSLNCGYSDQYTCQSSGCTWTLIPGIGGGVCSKS